MNKAQKILILSGTAGGGKSTFLCIFLELMGEDNVATLRTQLLHERFELSSYVGKKLLHSSDVSADFLKCKGATVLKSLTGGELINVEFKGNNQRLRLRGNFNVIVTSNCSLILHFEGDVAAWRRRIINLVYKLPPPSTPVPELHKIILQKEGSGILNWILAGVEKIRAANWQLNVPREVQDDNDDLLLQSESAQVFVSKRLFSCAGQDLTLNECYTGYVRFCASKTWAPFDRAQAGKAFEEAVMSQHGLGLRHDIKRGDSEQRGWKGLAPRPEDIPDSPDSKSKVTP